ncbi:acyl-CoA thioesterase [Actinomyces vulturis]|uniref:acyl-CoA thioesterase n=1 Tax=Actinomyces vulturis TaxID=1857645 RepID=UPI0008315F78|nr:acyl-CoA thioesterase domain-containing protein [Actinomyces vulturis]
MTHPYPVPVAHEEPLAGVTRVLALKEADGADRFRAGSLPQMAGRVYGGQVLAQGMLAAAATVPGCLPPVSPHESGASDELMLPHSVHGSFLRGGNPDQDIAFEVDRLHDGRSFVQRRTTATQANHTLLSMITSFQRPEEGPQDADPAPRVPRPEELTSALEIFRSIDHPVAKFLGRTAAFDVRHVEGNLYLRSSKQRASRQHVWMRARGAMPESASQVVHRALLTYVVDQIMLEPALRRQSLSWRTPGMSLATLDHAQWFHHDVNVNEWLLFVQDCPTFQSGRAMVRADVYSRDGRLISTVAQEGMIRVPESDTPRGHWQIRLGDNDSGGEIPA